MHRKCPKIGVLGDFRGENCNIYLSKPQKALPGPKTRVLTYYSPKSLHAFDYGPDLKRPKNGVRRPSWIFNFCDFSSYGTFCDQHWSLRVKFDNDRTNGSKVIGILVLHRKCIESAPKLGFWGILGVKTVIFIFLTPKRHLLGPKHAFWRITRSNRSTRLPRARSWEKKRHARPWFGQISPPPGDAIFHPIITKFGTFINLL